MNKPLMRIPYTAPFSPPHIIPHSAKTLSGAVAALREFFTSPVRAGLPASTVILSGAGLSVASGLADYRGANGTYRVNKTYRPIYYHEFLASHEARKRYWARSFLGWTTLLRGRPNAGHRAVGDLGALGLVSSVITQNVDSFHPQAHPHIPTLELHGYLRSTVCTSCWSEFPRDAFQDELARLNPVWAAFLAEAVAAGALADGESESEDHDHDHHNHPHHSGERRFRGIRANPDGDVELPGAPYTTFRYPACPTCLGHPPSLADGARAIVKVDREGAWMLGSTAGILKPAVVMFGESIKNRVKQEAEEAIDGAGRLLVLATSLATYSAWRLAKRARDRGMPIAIVNIGGVRGEEAFFLDLDPLQKGAEAVRVEMSTDTLLPALVEELRQHEPADKQDRTTVPLSVQKEVATAFKDMLS